MHISDSHTKVALSEVHPPTDAARHLRRDIAMRYRAVPIDTLTLALARLDDFDALDALRFIKGPDVVFVEASETQIDLALDRLYPAAPPHSTQTDEPVVELVNTMIADAHQRGASDIHLEPHGTRFRVRYRVDGALRDMDPPSAEHHAPMVSRIKIMAGLKIAEKRLPQDGRIQANLAEGAIDLRVSTIPTHHGESVVMRLLDQRDLSVGLSGLGFEPREQARFESLIQCPDGVALLTGPTGSGKTTTLYACLNHLNTPDRKIITVEDPVEYQLTGVNQTLVRTDIGMTFSAALRAMMRQAPNIIMIGEIRDRETADIAMNAALTGHLVLSTLHTNDAPSAITRLINIGVKPFLVASALRGVVAQRLVRKICPHCARTRSPTSSEAALLPKNHALWEGSGCTACEGTGFRGRVGVFEHMRVDEALGELIHDGATTSILRAAARHGGSTSLRAAGLKKVATGLTTLREVLRVTPNEGGA